METRLALFLASFVLALGFSFAKGAGPERTAAGILFCGLLATVILQGPLEYRFLEMEIGVFIVDSIMLILFVLLALYAERFWTIWIAGFQVIQTLSHLPQLLIPHILPETYKTIVSVWAYPMLIMLVWATWRHRQRLQTLGSDRSWSDFSLSQREVGPR